MKKIYVKPVVEFDKIESAQSFLAGSGDKTAGWDNNVIPGNMNQDDDDEEGSLAKGGSFACWEDDTENWAF